MGITYVRIVRNGNERYGTSCRMGFDVVQPRKRDAKSIASQVRTCTSERVAEVVGQALEVVGLELVLVDLEVQGRLVGNVQPANETLHRQRSPIPGSGWVERFQPDRLCKAFGCQLEMTDSISSR